MDITRIDDTQWAAVFQARRSWTALSGEQAERGLVPALHRVYAALGLKEPAVHRFRSPLAAMLAIPHLAAAHRLPSFGNFILKGIRESLCTPLGQGAQPQDLTWRGLGQQMADAFDLPVNSLIDGEFVEHFTDDLGAELRKVLGETAVRDRLASGLFHGIAPAALEWWKDVAVTRTWWWPFTSFVVTSDLPKSRETDGEGRLHSEEGPAIRFEDGCKVWAVGGVTVTERIFKRPETLTVEEIQAQNHAEVRRVMIQKMGAGEYLKRVGAKIVDMDSLTLVGSAPRALMEDRFGEKWLVGTDGSTARVYTMPVPRRARSCREAHTLIAGFDEGRLIAEA